MFFGPAARPLFGWFHAPEGTARDTAVVLCPAIGWEGFATYRTIRVLAEALAAEGFPVMRFDYDGTGDSFGSDEDADRVPAWLNSVEASVLEVAARSGASTVALVGLQLGATLAAQVSQKIRNLAALVLWAPVTQGKQWVRQMRAYRTLNARTSRLADGDEEAAGFLFRKQTVDAIGELDLLNLPPPNVPLLILRRDDLSPEPKLENRWKQAGADISSELTTGYAALMQEPRKSVVPQHTVRQIVGWLANTAATLHGQSGEVRAQPRLLASRTDEYSEEIVQIGPSDRIFGIIARPATARPNAPAFVFLNTGSDHRVGPNRMYVRLARQLASTGIASVRFDPTGVGDSGSTSSHSDAHPYSAARLEDATQVLNALVQRNVANQFVLGGLCSGAYVAFHIAATDPRVVGEILINQQTFAWNHGDSLEIKVRQNFKSSRFYRQAAFQPGIWRRVVKGEVNWRGIVASQARRVTRATARKIVRALGLGGTSVIGAFKDKLARGTDVFIVFGEEDGGIDALEEHVGHEGGCLRGRRGFRIEVLKGPDHSFSSYPEQQRLFELLVGHLLTLPQLDSAVAGNGTGRNR